MKKTGLYLQTGLFCAILLLLFAANLLSPERSFSEVENRTLRTRPQLSLARLLSKEYADEYEKYFSDQFIFREKWIAMKAGTELLSGKRSNNEVFLCDGETLVLPFHTPEERSITSRIQAVNDFTDRNPDLSVYMAMVPSSAEVWGDLLPSGAPNDSQAALLSRVADEVDARPVDLLAPLREHSGEEIFYRTDHHWTTLGAYYGYSAIMEAMDMKPLPLSEYAPETVTGSFFGTNYSRSGFQWVHPDHIEAYVQPGKERIVNYSGAQPVASALYDPDFLAKKDKYAYFFGGNTPLIEIETGHPEKPALLIIRDSFADCLTPFLFPHFSKISVVDPRYFHEEIDTYIKEGGFQYALICYSVPIFFSESSILMLK